MRKFISWNDFLIEQHSQNTAGKSCDTYTKHWAIGVHGHCNRDVFLWNKEHIRRISWDLPIMTDHFYILKVLYFPAHTVEMGAVFHRNIRMMECSNTLWR